MEEESNPKNGLKIFMEFLGTFILCGALNLSTFYYKSNDSAIQSMQPILVFLAFFTAITITRNISGGHINPAVTVAIWISDSDEIRKKNGLLYLYYIISQIFGAIVACIFSYIFYNKNVLQVSIKEGNTPICGLIIEAVGSFFFIYLILCQSNAKANIQEDQTISTFLITVALFAGSGVASNVSGGILNPAIGFSNIIIRLIAFKNTGDAKNIWIYILGPFIGGIVAALVYLYFFKTYFDEVLVSNDEIKEEFNKISNEELIKSEERKSDM